MRLIEPPRLRTAESREDDRRATWLELFFDLVFVVTVAQLSATLSHHPTPKGFVEFAGLFAPIWWAWVGFTFYADRFDTDDLVHRLLMLAGMFAVATLAVTVPDTFAGGSSAFVGTYLCVRALVVALNGRAWLHVREARPLLTAYISGFTVGWLLWLGSLLVATPARYWLWAAGTAIEIGTPLVSRHLIESAPIHVSHIPERMGLFILIVLGESVLAVVIGIEGVHLGLRPALVAAGTFVIAAAIWWLYFDYLDSSSLRRSVAAGQVFVYGHFPLAVGIGAVGAAARLAIEEAPRSSVPDGTSWILCGGLALYLLATAVIQLATVQGVRDVDFWLRLGGAAAAFALAPAGTVMPPLALVALLALILLVQLAVELAGHEAHATAPAPTPAG